MVGGGYYLVLSVGSGRISSPVVAFLNRFELSEKSVSAE